MLHDAICLAKQHSVVRVIAILRSVSTDRGRVLHVLEGAPEGVARCRDGAERQRLSIALRGVQCKCAQGRRWCIIEKALIVVMLCGVL